MSEEKKPFTVTDRRHFTREGEVRDSASTAAAPEPPPPAPPEPPPPPRAPAEPRRVIDPSHARAEDSYRQAAAMGGPELTAEEGGLDFVGLLVSLGTQASMMMGAARPGERPVPPDLAGARSMISLLEILRDKTEGRRTAEEDEVLEGLLYELRMQYVALARRGGP